MNKLLLIEQISKVIPDKIYLQLLYYKHFKRFINFKNPESFCEKIQWLKLYDRRPEYSMMVDKYEVKKYVANVVGEEYIIPTLGVWNDVSEIDWEMLPSQFVLKWNHDSGSIVICRDKENFDKEGAIKSLQFGAKVNGFWYGREWPYKNVRPRIIAEKFMSDGEQDLTDYKFFCFNGEPKYCQVIKDRHTKETIDFFDMEWVHQEFVGLNPATGPQAGPAAVCPPKPVKYEEMQTIAKKLSNGLPFSRVDLYEINKEIYFGEITFYPASGIGLFTPLEYNKILGDMIILPNKD